VTTSVYADATFNYHDGSMAAPTIAPVLDARSATVDFDRSGFTRIDHVSAVGDWHDQRQLDDVYRSEMAAFAVDFTGCDEAIAFPVISRSLEAAERVADYAPIEFVHSDFTDDYGPMVTGADRPYRAFLDPLLAERGIDRSTVTGASRLMVVQWWRNIGPIEADYPLAMCDAECVAPDRLLREMLPYYGGLRLDFEIFAVRPPADGHPDRWYTYPKMHSDEVVVLRTYDSACVADGRHFWTPHSAFRDPHVPDGPEHRRASIEARALCVWN
jgi:hypothetical protein